MEQDTYTDLMDTFKELENEMADNYDKKIDEEMALIICFIIDDLLTSIEFKEVIKP